MRVSTTDLQNAFGKYLALVEKEDIIITKNGRSVAKKPLPVQLFPCKRAGVYGLFQGRGYCQINFF